MIGSGSVLLRGVEMKLERTVLLFASVLAIASAVLLSGCAGFWDAPSSTTTTTTTPTTESSGVFYVANQTATANQLVAYQIVTGVLKTLGTYNLAGPASLSISPNGSFLYVSTLTQGIFAYQISSGGTLSALNGGVAIVPSVLDAQIQVDTSGQWLIAAFAIASNTDQVELEAIPLNPSTGLTTGATVPPVYVTVNNAVTIKQITISSDDDNIFVALGAGGTIVEPFVSSVAAGPLGAQATAILPPTGSETAYSVAVDPQLRVFYIGESNITIGSAAASGALFVFNYSSLGTTIPRTVPTQTSTSPIASGGLSPNAIVPEASGIYVYVANGQGDTTLGNIQAFSISGSTYALVALGSPIGSGYQPVGLTEDGGDEFILAVSDGGLESKGDPDLEAFTMSSGALTAALTATTGTDPVEAVAVAAVP